MNVEKIRNKKVSDRVVEQIELMIESGEFTIGEKLPSVRELCELFGVGRSAVRDAITTLKGKGTVEVKHGEGTYICGFDSSSLFKSQVLLPSIKDVHELFQVRKILETGMAEMASINRSEEMISEMEVLLSNQTDTGWGSDYSFHMLIAKASGNEILLQLVEFISSAMKKVMIEFYKQIEEDISLVRKIDQQHVTILQAIKEQNPKLAGQEMMLHLTTVETLLKSSVLEKA
ncbi:GntR family transcriptional regulator, transcriptional repressor for pyruvate dehydrogenase complex [Mesobacillus persicus]|uniref:GntR family transcriptional regulator, transcriptional repressor for pyruvate dehydrogenase complex n=1 Tax=Mesobacillus persicus TaxID=930146 RepID=A0A1H7ZP54_9BACI|nr:FadR/GntR family transcriptional regulator [Mesobacillus persicus]SEM60086.1 GntR family transcriptional regulator, transcriptional repressor for pyruvate dehydrogenase complex [Mesobacillus persicus]